MSRSGYTQINMGSPFLYPRGNTVLELLIAMFIISVGLFALVGLSMSNFLASRESLNELLAANFAREGIELVRNIRDSNKYEEDSGSSNSSVWRNGLSTSGEFGLNTSTMQLVAATNANKGIKRASDGTYHQGVTLSSETSTAFERAVFISPICSSGSSGNDTFGRSDSTCTFSNTGSGAGSVIGIQAVVAVSWLEGTRSRKVMVEERLYNW